MGESMYEDAGQNLEALLDAHGQDIWNYLFSLTKDVHLADDLAQETFLRAYIHLTSFRNEASPRTWLLKIARNQFFDHYRKASVRRSVLTDNVRTSSTNVSAEQEVLDQMGVDHVWQCALALPQKLREVLILHANQQLKPAEISVVLGISERAVRSRLYRARSRMESILKEGDVRA